MIEYSFEKMDGAGNDFIALFPNTQPELELTSGIIQKLCHRKHGIGADGIIVARKHPDYDFEMEYYNADGSRGSFCGNGARCTVKFAYDKGLLPSGKTKFLFGTDVYYGEVINESVVTISLTEPKDIKQSLSVVLDEKTLHGDFADTGSPHVIFNYKDIGNDADFDSFDAFSLGRALRYAEEFATKGTNVNFYSLEDNFIKIRTYERGVEDETLACGTGSVAVAILAALRNYTKPPVKILTRGGFELVIDFSIDNNRINNVSLTGPVSKNFEGIFDLNKYSK